MASGCRAWSRECKSRVVKARRLEKNEGNNLFDYDRVNGDQLVPIETRSIGRMCLPDVIADRRQ